MPRSHIVTPKPSALLAVVALAIVHRLRPQWVAIPLADAAAQEEISAQRLSRLCTRTTSMFENVLGNLTQRGRPAKDECKAEAELAKTRALLAVATSLLQAIPLRGNKVRALLVGAWLRLRQAHSSISHRQFCATLGISERAFRRWRKDPAAQNNINNDAIIEPKPARKRPKKRPLRRGRFNFDVTLPDTQIAADTTDLDVFGIKLKLIATQDVGGRDTDLLDNVIIDTKEDAARVEQVLTETLANLKGAQAISDQGTPYMAELTRKALEDIEVDHAPQVEGDPLGKATIERAFGTAKTIAAPLFVLTGHLAQKFPALCDSQFATAFARLVVTFLLRAYQAGARAAHRAAEQRGRIDEPTLSRLAAENRDKAHAELRSKRMLLEHIHQTLGMDVPMTKFIRQFSTRPLPVLRLAQKDFARQAHRGDIKNRTGYFAWFVNKHLDPYSQQQTKRRGQQERARCRVDDEEHKARQQRSWHENPAQWLMHALETIAAFWLPDQGTLAGGGAGPGVAWVRGAIARLVETHGARTARDIAHGTADIFARTFATKIGEQGVFAVVKLLFEEVRCLAPQAGGRKVAEDFVAAILARDGPSKPRPPPPSHLRN